MYFTLKPPYRGQIRNLQILSDSLQKNVLIITGTDTQGLNHDNLPDLTNQIEKTILSNACIELIVIDITGDPNQVDNPDLPITARQLRQHLLIHAIRWSDIFSLAVVVVRNSKYQQILYL